jgi:hypothetical protein
MKAIFWTLMMAAGAFVGLGWLANYFSSIF